MVEIPVLDQKIPANVEFFVIPPGERGGREQWPYPQEISPRRAFGIHKAGDLPREDFYHSTTRDRANRNDVFGQKKN